MNTYKKIVLGVIILFVLVIIFLFSWNFYQKLPGESWNRTDFVNTAICGENNEKCVTNIDCINEKCPANMFCVQIGGSAFANCVYTNFQEKYHYSCIFRESFPPSIENCWLKK